MARSNVSNSIKELESWGLIRRVPVMGDRRDFFEADSDVWSVAAKIVAGRKQREIDPAIATLSACLAEGDSDPKLHPVARQRLSEMLELTRTAAAWYDQMSVVPRPKLMALIKFGAKIINLLPQRKPK
jgi:DNA-binding transcriptional regulator GbsR (MarR family)